MSLRVIPSFVLQVRAFVRSRALAVLLAVVALVVLGLPYFLRSDGTAEGARSLLIQTTLGAAFAVVAAAVLAAACGAFAGERRTRRLALTAVRPVTMMSVWFGKLLALVAVAALALFFAAALVLVRVDPVPCSHVVQPTMPPPEAEAVAAYERFMKDPGAPKDIKSADRRAVIAQLAARASERFDVVPPGGTASWRFDLPAASTSVVVRLRFTTDFDLRSSLVGVFSLCAGDIPVAVASISNLTQSVLFVPLAPRAAGGLGPYELSFANAGRTSVMLRPRHDIALMLPADSFAANLFRAVLELLVVVTLLAALGLFLSAAFSRPVAIFVASILVAVTLMAPSVLVQFPSELGGSWTNRVGLRISRTILGATRSVGELHPLASVAAGECVEGRGVATAFATNAVLFPVILMLLSGLVLRYRPPEDD